MTPEEMKSIYKLDKKLQLYKKAIEDIEVICAEQNLKFDTTACEVLDVIEKLFDEIKSLVS